MKKNYIQLKQIAVEMRQQGLSYNEIRKEIGVSKSTLSLWLKNIRLKPEHRERLYTKQIQILARGPQSQRERRQREIDSIINEAAKETSALSQETYKLFGAALYWTEGSKTKDFAITNSDPYLVAFITKWFENFFNVSPNQMKAYLNIYPQQSEEKIKKFWSDLTGIPLENFGKSFIKPLNKGYKKNNLYYGTIKVRVERGTDMRYKTFGWIRAALQEINPKVKSTERKWAALKKYKAHAGKYPIAPHNSTGRVAPS